MKKYEAIAKGFEEYGRYSRFMIYNMEFKEAFFSSRNDGFFKQRIKRDQIDFEFDLVNMNLNCDLDTKGWDAAEVAGGVFTPENMLWNQKELISICEFADIGDVLIYEDCAMKNLVSSKQKNTIWIGFKSGGIDNKDEEAHLLKVVRTHDGREIPEHLKCKQDQNEKGG